MPPNEGQMLRLWIHFILKHRERNPLGWTDWPWGHAPLHSSTDDMAAGVINPVPCTAIPFIIVTGHKGLMTTLFLWLASHDIQVTFKRTMSWLLCLLGKDKAVLLFSKHLIWVQVQSRILIRTDLPPLTWNRGRSWPCCRSLLSAFLVFLL